MPRGASLDIEGREVEMDDVLASKLGFINVAAYMEHKLRRDTITLEKLLVEVCNLHQMVASLSDRLTATGTERIG